MKEHKKLYKSGKLWMTATVVALAAGTMATTTVHADAAAGNQTPATSQTANTDQQKLANDIANAQKEVNDQQAVVDQDQQAVNSAKSALNDAQAKAETAAENAQTATDKYNQLNQRRDTETKQRDAYKQEVATKTAAYDNSAEAKDLQNQIDSLHSQLLQLVPDNDDFVKSLAEAKQLSPEDHAKYNKLNRQYDTLRRKLRNNRDAAAGEAQQKLTDLNHVFSQHITEWRNAMNQQTKANNEKRAADQALRTAQANNENAAKKLSDDQQQLQTLKNKLAQLQAQQNQPTTQHDNEKYTDLNPDALVKVTVEQDATNVPVPTLDPSAIINDTNSAFLMLAVSHPLYPAGTKVAWANPAKVIADAKVPGDHDEDVYLIFPDHSHSKTFNVKNILHVNAKSTTPSTGDDSNTNNPSNPTHNEDDHTLTVHYIEIVGNNQDGTPITRTVGTQTFTGNEGTTISGDQIHVPAGYHLATPGLTLTITGEDVVNDVPVLSDTIAPDDQDQPADHKNTDHSPASQLPDGAKIVDGHVVDANGHIIPGWKVVNGRAVKADQVKTREAYRAQQARKNAQTLPQTGNAESVAAMSLGVAALAGMFGFAGLSKKRG